ncbi:helix-turn-helix domain-containing protein [Streptosporangium sp. NBC_01755]|uniref:helix-turn-helix domain-containing protein n=1 Tax=Streptosporangium sp. NBC_01755 TaxID=2975949 RepID=UPI002DD7D8C1|nr:helix-turn-helix domain-containing protein [Streptosporangium sp. NBC_01755]WSC98443.1 helix-turn-helix domain-containing protein [Streptosporangium sp. NBC_01755]
MAKKSPQYLTLPTVCKRLGRHRSTVTRMIKRGDLEAIKTQASPQGRVLISKESFDRYQALQESEQVAG